jgi:hypothetical protein
VVYLEQHGGAVNCIAGVGSADLASVDLDTGAVTTTSDGVRCAQRLAASQGAYSLWYHSFSLNFPGTAYLAGASGDLTSPGTPFAVGDQSAITLAVDAVHHLALVGFTFPETTLVYGVGGVYHDDNATSRIVLVDLTTGKITTTLTGLSLSGATFSDGGATANTPTVQLDPATRTGWTYASGAAQIQQFSY